MMSKTKKKALLFFLLLLIASVTYWAVFQTDRNADVLPPKSESALLNPSPTKADTYDPFKEELDFVCSFTFSKQDMDALYLGESWELGLRAIEVIDEKEGRLLLVAYFKGGVTPLALLLVDSKTGEIYQKRPALGSFFLPDKGRLSMPNFLKGNGAMIHFEIADNCKDFVLKSTPLPESLKLNDLQPVLPFSIDSTTDDASYSKTIWLGELGFTRYFTDNWWVFYTKKLIYFYNRKTGKHITMPSLFGEESRVAVSDDLAVIWKDKISSYEDQTAYCKYSGNTAFYTRISNDDRKWVKLNYDVVGNDKLLFIPCEDLILVSEVSTERDLLNPVTRIYEITGKMEQKEIASFNDVSPRIIRQRDRFVLELREYEFGRDDPCRTIRSRYYPIDSLDIEVAHGTYAFVPGDFYRGTVCTQSGKRLDSVYTPDTGRYLELTICGESWKSTDKRMSGSVTCYKGYMAISSMTKQGFLVNLFKISDDYISTNYWAYLYLQ